MALNVAISAVPYCLSSRRFPRRSDATSRKSRPMAASTTTTGQAGDDDVKEANDGVDDGGEDGANAIHDSHQAVADGAEDGFDLGKN
jgi:hypothetical protein